LLSVIIPAPSGAADTAACLASVQHSVATLHLACEFILIDDASDPAENILELFVRNRAAPSAHRFIIARSIKHQHYTGVFSLGLHLATGDNVLFVSNDMLMTPSFLMALMGVSALQAGFGIVRGTSNYVDSHPEHQVPAPNDMRSYQDLEKFSRSVLETNALATRRTRSCPRTRC
jgi:hypothetical protein